MEDEIIRMIQDGALDVSLESITTAIKRRQEMLSRIALITLKAGDVFRIKQVSPKYLNGALVEFIEYTGGAAPVRVKFVYGINRYRSGSIINLRESHIGRIEND